ncbi:MAG: hypothetical protein MUD01_26190, partial [Chloroflexaceae bacterium]|nr:hypothetical protein [Chloroflexaceae bacterium]
MNHTRVEQPVVRPVSQHHGLRAWLARHQLLAFFGLTYLISWSIWGVEPLLAMVDQRSARWFSFLASFGPTLAAMALTSVLQRERAPLPHQVRRFWVVGLVLAATLLVNLSLLGELWSGSFTVFTVVLLLIITLLPAWIFWNAFSARRGLRELLQSLVAWRARPRWYAAALLLPLLVSLGGLGVLVLLGQPLPPFPRTEPLAGLPTLLLITFMATLFYGGPLGEEAGWRGYALPRLQA